MKSHSSRWREPSLRVFDHRPVAFEIADGDVADLEVECGAALEQRRGLVLDDLLLTVDRDVAAGQPGDRDVCGASLPAQVDPAVAQALAPEPLADAEFVQKLHRVVLEQARAHPPRDVFARPVLEHHALDPLALEEQRQRQPRRTGTDDSDLGSHGVTRESIGTGMVQRYLPHTRRESGGDRTQ